jgi:SAM-dependent methyltransferase
VFSNAALHWMKRANDVIDGVWRALVPGGRFVAECGGKGNIAKIEAALLAALARRGLDGMRHYPWYYPSTDEYRGRVTARGFVVRSIDLVQRPTLLPDDISGWLETFAGAFVGMVPATGRADFIAEVREQLRPDLCGVDGRWTADYVRLRFAAVRPPASTPG